MSFERSYEPGDFEAEIYAAWEASGAFQPKKAEEAFSIVMPPPNANGNLHIGHGLTIALEDALTRFYRLKGKSAWFVPGADHAGFETWVVFERTLEKIGESRFNYSRDELYARVWDFVQEQRGNMELQVRSLGASCAWDDLTFTLDEKIIKRVYQTFEKMFKDGMVYRGEKLVNYCPKHQTAFADIEVEHQDEEGKLYDIKYDSLVVSTTRPETLFGDTAVAVNPKDERYKDLIGKFVSLPLTDRKIPVIADEHAEMEYGTGVVKITPAHDYDDFEVGERHNLPRIRVIDDAGRMINCGEGYDGLTTEEARKAVLKALREQNLLVGEHKIQHAVAHCYKCGAVIEPTLKEQWFVDVKKLAKKAVAHLNKGEIKFYPENKKKVLINYFEGLKDWNISRQIPWGIAIPMFHKVSSGQISSSEDALGEQGQSSLDNFASPTSESQNSVSFAQSRSGNTGHVLRSRVNSSDSEIAKLQDISDKTDLAPEWVFDTRTHLKEIEIDGVKYVRDEDTFDTWFSSSQWPLVCTNWQEGEENPFYPLNVMETAGDILFAWVARMIMMGVYITDTVPFREVYLHGLVLDEHGKKMSKSKGNVINPIELVAKYGSDAFRLGILRGRSAGMNQAFSEQSVVAGRNLCNKLWNVARLIADVGKSDPSRANDAPKASYTSENMGEDWILREINYCLEEVERDMENYRFSEAVEVLYTTIWDKYADWFIESQKMFKNGSLLRETLKALLIALHPFAPFLTEAIWQNLDFTEGMIINQKWPEKFEFDPISAENFERLKDVVTEVRGTLAALPKEFRNRKYNLLYGDDSLVKDNSLLIAKLAGVEAVLPTNGQPRGIRLALANHEVYLDVTEDVVKAYREALTEKILAVGRELDGLNMRMMNPRYVEKAPAELVKETRDGILEKEKLIERLKKELELI